MGGKGPFRKRPTFSLTLTRDIIRILKPFPSSPPVKSKSNTLVIFSCSVRTYSPAHHLLLRPVLLSEGSSSL